MSLRKAMLLCLCAALMLARCSNAPIAGGSDNPDFKVVGSVYNENGTPASGVRVIVLPADFNPISDLSVTILVDTTNAAGTYRITVPGPGMYCLDAVHLTERTRLLISGIDVAESTTMLPDGVLKKSGTILVDTAVVGLGGGFAYIPGTTIYRQLVVRGGACVVDSVPAGMIPELRYGTAGSSATQVIRADIEVVALQPSYVAYPFWRNVRNLILNTSVTGADVAGNVYDFPVLVRLNTSNFDFDGARSGGADIRFAKADNVPLAHEIERWDPASGKAEVWVRVDTVYGNTSTQSIRMYWGNPEAVSQSQSAVVFDTATGFVGVWHFAEAGNATAFDATQNGYNGTPYSLTTASAVEGAVGGARRFDGSSQYISMPNTADSRLNFPEDGTYSLSAWVYADTLSTAWSCIAGKGHEQYYLQLKGLGNNRATWEFVEFQDQRGWEYTEDSVPPAPQAGVWLHITGVRSGIQQRLYINGELVKDTVSLMAGLYSRNSTDNFMIGRFARAVTIPENHGWGYFKGRIDEIRVSKRSLNSNWVRLNYMNQKEYDQLVVHEIP